MQAVAPASTSITTGPSASAPSIATNNTMSSNSTSNVAPSGLGAAGSGSAGSIGGSTIGSGGGGSKPPKVRHTNGTQTGVYRVDAIKDIAESLNIVLTENITSSLASDVEYRINQVIEEAARFMRHGRRTTLTTSDIDQALRVLNIEPLYGHTPFNPTTFRRALPFANSTQPNAYPYGGGAASSSNPLGASGGVAAAGFGAGGGIGGPGAVYFPEDEEIDFDRVLREEKIALPKGVSWTAHWLAVEGVQPMIPENPPAIPREGDSDPLAKGELLGKVVNGLGSLPVMNGVNGVNGVMPGTMNGLLTPSVGLKKPGQPGQPSASQAQHLVKQVLSRELQLYYARLTSSLLPSSPSPGAASSDYAKRTAALASLRHDAGLQALLPYLVRWVGEGVVGVLKEDHNGAERETHGKVLEVLLDAIGAILDNQTLFVEPYLHQILPPILSILLHSSLPSSPSSPTTPTHLRTTASQTLSKLLTQHSTTYPSLSPRIMKTLLLALVSPNKSAGTREGAIKGLVGVGKEAVRKGLVEGGGARVVGREFSESGVGGAGRREKEKEREREGVLRAVLDALSGLQPDDDDDNNVGGSDGKESRKAHRNRMSISLDPGNEEDAKVLVKLKEVLGEYFAGQVAEDADWAREVLGLGPTGARGV